MNPAELIVVVLALVILGILLVSRSAAQGRIAPPPVRDDTDRLVREVQQLKERVQVLERVITDTRGTVDLDREIERLRDR